MNTKLVQVDVESLQNQATHKQAMARLKEAGEKSSGMVDWSLFRQKQYMDWEEMH